MFRWSRFESLNDPISTLLNDRWLRFWFSERIELSKPQIQRKTLTAGFLGKSDKQFIKARPVKPSEQEKKLRPSRIRVNKMKKFILCFLGLLIVGLSAFAQSHPSVSFVNNTGYTVHYLHVKSTASNDWGPDRLGSGVILNNNAFTFTLPFAIDAVNRYDIRMKDSDGDTYTKQNVLVSNNGRVVFTFDDFDGKNNSSVSTGSGTYPSITIVNETGYTVRKVLISRPQDGWGSDWLGSNEFLYNANTRSFNLHHTLSDANRYDIRLEDTDGDTYTKMNVLVANNSRIVFVSADIDR